MKKNKGAASVLVLFLLMVLVTLGAFAIASSNANYKLSQRALSWNNMFYTLDATAEEYLAIIDTKLAEAEKKAIDIIQNSAEIPAELKQAMDTDLNEEQIFNFAFLYYANEMIDELTLIYPEIEVYIFGSAPLIRSLWIDFTLNSSLPDYEKCFLKVSMWIEPALHVSNDNGNLSVEWENNLRYIVSDWYEYQLVDEVEELYELWDGTF